MNKRLGWVVKGGWKHWEENKEKEEWLLQKRGGDFVRNEGRGIQEQEWATRSPGKGLPTIGNIKPTIQIGCEPKRQTSPLASFWVGTIGAICGDLLRSCVSTKTRAGKCLKNGQEVMLKVVLEDLLEDLPGEREGTKGMKIEIVSGKKNSSASEKARIKRTEQYRVFLGIDSLMRGTRNSSVCIGWWEIWSLKQEIGVEGKTVTTGRRSLLVGEVTTESGHINPGSINTGNIHVHKSTQIETQFPRKGDGPRMLLWMLWAEPYAELLGRHFQIILNGPQCWAGLHAHHLTPTMGKRTQ